MTNLRYIVRLATLFRALGAAGDTGGSLKSVEQHFIRLHVATTPKRVSISTHSYFFHTITHTFSHVSYEPFYLVLCF